MINYLDSLGFSMSQINVILKEDNEILQEFKNTLAKFTPESIDVLTSSNVEEIEYFMECFKRPAFRMYIDKFVNVLSSGKSLKVFHNNIEADVYDKSITEICHFLSLEKGESYAEVLLNDEYKNFRCFVDTDANAKPPIDTLEYARKNKTLTQAMYIRAFHLMLAEKGITKNQQKLIKLAMSHIDDFKDSSIYSADFIKMLEAGLDIKDALEICNKEYFNLGQLLEVKTDLDKKGYDKELISDILKDIRIHFTINLTSFENLLKLYDSGYPIDVMFHVEKFDNETIDNYVKFCENADLKDVKMFNKKFCKYSDDFLVRANVDNHLFFALLILNKVISAYPETVRYLVQSNFYDCLSSVKMFIKNSGMAKCGENYIDLFFTNEVDFSQKNVSKHAINSDCVATLLNAVTRGVDVEVLELLRVNLLDKDAMLSAINLYNSGFTNVPTESLKKLNSTEIDAIAMLLKAGLKFESFDKTIDEELEL